MEKLPRESNPWQTLSGEVKLDTPWIEVTLHQVINPSGSAGIYGVTRFKNKAIGILVLDEHMNTWIVGQYRYPIDAYSWEIPEGGGPLDEDPLDAAKRELKEEAGITARNWQLLQTLHTSNSATNEYAVIYLATGLSFGESEPEPDEQLQIRKLPFEELYQRVKSGEITDSLTVAAVLKLKLLLLEGFLIQ